MTREPIYAALFAKLASLPGVETASRRLKHWNDVPAIEQPALFMTQQGEVAEPQPAGLPTRWTLSVMVYVYVKSPSDDAAPAALLNPVLDALERALAPENQITNRNTLGGLVEHCWIEGGIETDEGVLGEQSVALVPIRIFTA